MFTTGADPEASAAGLMAADKAARRSPSSPLHKQQRAVDPGPPLQTRARPLYGNKGRQKWSHVTQEANSVQNGVLGWYVRHVAATPSAAPNNEAKIPETMLAVCVRRHRIPVCVCSWHDGGHTQAAPQNQTPVQFPSSCAFSNRIPKIWDTTKKVYAQLILYCACLSVNPGSCRPNVALPPDTTGGAVSGVKTRQRRMRTTFQV